MLIASDCSLWLQRTASSNIWHSTWEIEDDNDDNDGNHGGSSADGDAEIISSDILMFWKYKTWAVLKLGCVYFQ